MYFTQDTEDTFSDIETELDDIRSTATDNFTTSDEVGCDINSTVISTSNNHSSNTNDVVGNNSNGNYDRPISDNKVANPTHRKKLFKATTNMAYNWKQWIDFAHANMTYITFTITTRGISTCNRNVKSDVQRKSKNKNSEDDSVMLTSFLYRASFNRFYIDEETFSDDEDGLSITVSSKSLKETLSKTIKSGNSIKIYINENSKYLRFDIYATSGNIRRAKIRILSPDKHNISTETYAEPTGYDMENPIVVVPWGEFATAFKTNMTDAKSMIISVQKNALKIEVGEQNIHSTANTLGKWRSKNHSDGEIIYKERYQKDTAVRTAKLSQLRSNIQVYGNAKLPMLYCASISQLGFTNLYTIGHSLHK